MFSDKELILISETKSSDFSISGNGELGIFILFKDDNEKESSISFLTKVLSAKKINLEKDTNYASLEAAKSISFFQLENKPKHLLLFDIKLSDVGINIEIKPYNFIQINGVNVLFADNLHVIKSDENMKRKLWESLKNWSI